MSRSFFVGCVVLAGILGAGVTALNLSPEDLSPEADVAVQPSKPATINAQSATIVEPSEDGVGPLEKAGRVADDLIEKAGLSSGDVEVITEKAKEIGEKAAEKAEVVVEKVKETASRAIVKAEELADEGKKAAAEAAGDLGETINTGK